jgi:hypothetical protein
MDNYRIAAEGNGFQVSRTSPDGRVWLIGRFPSRDNAQHWIDHQLKMTNRRDTSPGRGANQASAIVTK